MMALLLLSACTPWAAYPELEGGYEFHNPLLEPMPSLMAESIRWTHANHGSGHDDFVINLPAGTPLSLYDSMRRRVGGAGPMTSTEQWAYHIFQVKARGGQGQVDILYPKDEPGSYEFATLFLNHDIPGGWRVEDQRIWRVPFDVPQPNYAAPNSTPTEERDA